MSDYVRVRLADHAFPPASRWEIADAILADRTLLVVAKPRCERCDGCGHNCIDGTVEGTIVCFDCGGTGYVPMVALPAKVVEDAVDLLTELLLLLGSEPADDPVLKAVRLAQEAGNG